MPVVNAAVETNSRATQTSGAGLEFGCDIVFPLDHAVLCFFNHDPDRFVGVDQSQFDFAQVLSALARPVHVQR